MPLPKLINLMSPELPTKVKVAVKRLRHNIIYGINFAVKRRNISNKHWVYFPENKYLFHRISFPMNFSLSMTPKGWSSITIEVAESIHKKIPKGEKLIKKVTDDLIRAGVVKKYLNNRINLSNILLEDRKDRRGKRNIRFKEIKLAGNNSNNSNVYAIGDDIYVYLKIKNSYPSDIVAKLALSIRTTNEIGLISCDSELKGKTYRIPRSSESAWVCKIYSSPLNYGDYYINIAIFYGNEQGDWIASATKFSIKSGSFDGRVATNPFPVLSRFE